MPDVGGSTAAVNGAGAGESATTTAAIFAGPGEMRARCRALDWAATALGPVEQSSPPLRTAVVLCLDSALPTCIYAGSELLLLYNDLWRPWLGTAKHPGALGRPAHEVWAEIWTVVAPEFAQVLAGGPPIAHENQPLMIDRGHGPEETFFTYALSPVRDAAGTIVAVHNVCVETSGRVRAERALSRLIAASTAVMAIYSGPDHVITYVNPTWERLDDVYLSGERYAVEELSLPIQRRPGGPLEQSYWSFVWEPATLPDAADPARDGSASGAEASREPTASGLGRDILCHAIDVTAQVLARREVERLLAEAEAARGALAASEARYRLAVDAAEIGTWTWDLTTDTTAFDARVRATFGIDSDEPAPRVEVLATRVHPEDRDRVAAALAAAADPAGDGRYVAEYRVLQPDGSVRWAAVAGLMGFANDGPSRRPVSLLGTAMDITARKRAETDRARLLADAEAARLAAEAARAEAEAANQTKSDFLAVMSHELRTPLNAIGGYAQLMELGLHGPVTPEQVTALGRIQRGQQHLLGLINSVLNYAKLEAGHVHYETADVPVTEALAEVTALVAPQARLKGLALVTAACASDPDGSLLVARADPEKLRQVLLNLLSNAVKFTRGGGTVTVGCRAIPDGESSDPRVALTVADTGRGIAPDQLARVFAPFVQVDQRLTRTEEGTGLGLAISRDLARGMGGDLTVESAPSVGSTFTLTLPRGTLSAPGS